MSPTTISNSERRAVSRFARRVLVFAAPLLAAVLAVEACLWRTGDLWPLRAVVDRQMAHGDLLFGSGYFDRDRAYQTAMRDRKRPAILVLGSSRVLQVRDFMFHPLEGKFYNAGMTIESLDDFLELIASYEREPLGRPRVILLGLDPGWLAAEGKSARMRPHDFRPWLPGDHARLLRTFLFSGRGGLSPHALLQGGGGASPYYAHPALGNLALREGSGFRWDGSRQYRPRILLEFAADPRYRDRERPPMIERVRKRTTPFDRGGLRPQFFADLEAAIARLRALDIELLALLPPFSDEVREEIEALPDWRALWRRYRLELPRRLARQGVLCLDATSHGALALSDDYLFDGVHPSEVYMAHAVLWFLHNIPETSYLQGVDGLSLERRLAGPGVMPLSLQPPPDDAVH